MLVVFLIGETRWCFVRIFSCTWFGHGPEHVGDNDIYNNNNNNNNNNGE